MAPEVLLLVLAIVGLGAAALVVYGVQTTRARAASPEMESRLERYGHVADVVEVPPEERRSGSFMADRLDDAVRERGFSERVRLALSRADLRMTVGEWILVRLGSAAAASVLGLLMGRSSVGLAILFGIFLAGAGWMIPQFYLSHRASQRTKKFNGQLGDTIGMMANSLRAGYSLLQTMELVSRESPPPMAEEFRRVVREVGLGISYQQALDNMMRRIPSEDLDLLVSAIKIQAEIGGNLGQILDVIGETIRERVRIKGEIRTLTAQQSISAYVIAGLPIAMGGMMMLLNPDYMLAMFQWPYICMPIAGIVLEVVGYLIMRKIVAIEV